MKDVTRLTRRGALKAGATFAAGAAAVRVLSDPAKAEDLGRFGSQPAVNPTHLILLKGGTIISMDPKVGDLVRGNLLIEGKKIAAIAPELNPAGAQVIDAQDTIIVPGFVDCHRHSWEAQLRRINPNSPTLADYSNATHLSFAKA
jgi:5-methylthioadenosine/S-adenosylhomocysteine deaminase